MFILFGACFFGHFLPLLTEQGIRLFAKIEVILTEKNNKVNIRGETKCTLSFANYCQSFAQKIEFEAFFQAKPES